MRAILVGAETNQKGDNDDNLDDNDNLGDNDNKLDDEKLLAGIVGQQG